MTNLIFFSRLLGGGARPPLTTPVNQPNCSHKLSLCSTVVRNCCKGDDQNQYGKHPILGTRPYTPNPLTDRLEIWRGWLCRRYDTTCQKLRKSAPVGRPDIGVKYHVQMFFYLLNIFLADFLRSSREHISGSIATVFVSNDVFRWGLISSGVPISTSKFFTTETPKTSIFWPVFGLRNFSAKTLYNGEVHQ